MKDFKVEPEKKKRPLLKYSIYALFAALGIVGATGCFPYIYTDYPTMGTVTTSTLDKAAVVQIVDSMFSDSLGIVMDHDRLFVLQTNDQVVIFEADGYSDSNRIAYEFTSGYDYYYESANSTLDYDEIDCISNYCFDGWRILILDGYDEIGISNEVDEFVYYYTNL
jgi:hypothetical protein